MLKLKGTGIAIVTPFKKDGSIDYNALENLINFWIKGDVEYLVVMGTTGESVTLSAEEKKALLAFTAEKIHGRVPLVVGIGGNNTSEVVQNLETYDLSKVDAVLSVAPYYNKPNQQGYFEHFMAVADASPKPVILYNVPGRTGSNMTAATTLKLANAHKNILGIKEASGNLEQITDIIMNKPEHFQVISGDDALTLPIIASGGTGVISVVANAYPYEFSEMVRFCLADDFESARELHFKLFDFTRFIFLDGNPGGIKAALYKKGLCENTLRAPLAPVNNEVYEKIIRAVEKLG
ncbi:MAG: 4-hydroxy-tetrahydrodipicolinate synthase [Flavobacteriales bacterium]